MKYSAKEPYYVETFYKVVNIKDADSLIVKNELTKEEKEIRLYGIDAPEIRINRKLKIDEEKSHLPASLLMELGWEARNYLTTVLSVDDRITIITETKNAYDVYNRQLAYVILKSGECLNELLLQNGYAKASREYYCSKLPEYQLMNRQAQINRRGLYAKIPHF
ncbi:thermonuclease family protein [Faecalibacter sp. LW9]|uniref:thermonuclease family protein n=1 Tax=Faecalibacter sp. LW9 TaxID=3103144 RepID=UPI002AFE233F|nr:thermonuclease family protein [Faecalibacter sp. LW9]